MWNCTNPLSHDKFSSRIGQFQGKVFWEEKKLLFGKCRLEIGYSFRGASLSCFRSKLIDIVLTMWCVRRVTEWYSLLLLSLTQAISGDILPSLTNDSFNRENFVKPLEMDIGRRVCHGRFHFIHFLHHYDLHTITLPITILIINVYVKTRRPHHVHDEKGVHLWRFGDLPTHLCKFYPTSYFYL